MEISANFAFLTQEFPHVAESAGFAEQHVYGDPRASCFHARHGLERLPDPAKYFKEQGFKFIGGTEGEKGQKCA